MNHQPTIRAMTFNIRGARGSDDDGINAWQNRADLNVQTIKAYTPDIIGFQECQQGNLDIYASQLAGYAHEPGLPTSNADPAKHEYLAIFWRSDQFERIESGGFYLSQTPETWSGDWDTACVRAANWVKLRHITSGHTLIHLNTHLDHVSKLARQEGSKLILQKLSDLNTDNLPVILTGDFNANAWNPDNLSDSPRTDTCHQLYLDQGFVDTFSAAGHVDTESVNTFHGFKGSTCSPVDHQMSLRIDWILTRNGTQQLSTTACTIIRDEAPPLYPSDHYPVLAELVLIG